MAGLLHSHEGTGVGLRPGDFAGPSRLGAIAPESLTGSPAPDAAIYAGELT